MIKKAIAVFLVAGSLVLAVLILVGNESIIAPTEPKTAVKNEALPQKTTASNEEFRENSTKKIAKSIARELVKSEKLTGADFLNPDDLVSGILPDLQESFDFSAGEEQDLSREIKINDLRIVKSSDKALAENYFKNLRVIIKTNFPDLTIGFSQPSTEDFKLTALAYQKMAAAVYDLIIPENLTEIHREEIRLLTLYQKIFESLARYQDDPLKALASADLLQKTGPQLENLANMKLIFIKNNDLNI